MDVNYDGYKDSDKGTVHAGICDKRLCGYYSKGAMQCNSRGKTLSYYGAYTKCMNFMCRLVPRSVARKYAAGMNQ